MALRGASLTYRHSNLRRSVASHAPTMHSAAAKAAALGAAAAAPDAPLVSDLGPMLQKVKELNNGAEALHELVPFTVDGAVLGRMRPA